MCHLVFLLINGEREKKRTQVSIRRITKAIVQRWWWWRRRRRKKKIPNDTHLKWTVLSNWEMKSDDDAIAMRKRHDERRHGEREKMRERGRDGDTEKEREKIWERRRQREILFIQLVMTRKRRVVACVDLTCICASGVSQTTSSRDLLLFN